MNSSLYFFLLFGVIFYLLIIFWLLKKQLLAVRYGIIWLFSGFILLIFTIFPYSMFVIGDIMQISDPTNFIFLAAIAFILLVLLSLSSIVSGFSEKIKSLAQANALLEERVRRLEKEFKK